MVQEQLEERQVVLCTVDKIAGTTIFVKIENNGEGTITTSEIAPGRIRNLRDYVVPGKKIVCKILSIGGDRIHLSLRRVKQNERKELLEKISKEKGFIAIIKKVLGLGGDKKVEEITSKINLIEFFEQAKQNPKILEGYFNKEHAQKILKILESKKEKLKEINQIFTLSNKSPNGIIIIKKIIDDACKNSKCDISYIAAGKFSIKIQGQDFKKIRAEINFILENIEKQAKKHGCEFSLEKN